MGIETGKAFNVGGFSEGQPRHLDYHRELVILESTHSVIGGAQDNKGDIDNC
jgi:hypothetical protein